MTNQENTFLGFTGIEDVLESMFKYNKINLHKILNIAFIMTLALLFAPFLEQWIWSPMWTLVFFYAAVFLDFVTAVAASWEDKKFVTQKAMKMPLIMAAYFMVLTFLHSLPKVIEAFEINDVLSPAAFKFLAISVYFMFLFINFLSSLLHMSKLGLIPNSVAKYIERFIDVHKYKLESKTEMLLNNDKKNTDNEQNV